MIPEESEKAKKIPFHNLHLWSLKIQKIHLWSLYLQSIQLKQYNTIYQNPIKPNPTQAHPPKPTIQSTQTHPESTLS